MSFIVSFRKRFGNLMPAGLRTFLLRHISMLEQRTAWWESKDPYQDEPPYSTYNSPYPVKLGIIKEFWHRHIHYIAACHEMKVAYEIIDITAPDWLESFKNSDCDAFLVNPSVQLSQWKTMFDERLKTIVEVLGKKIFPNLNEIYMYESKRRMAYWLEASGIPHAKTFISYRKCEALEYAADCSLPVVVKTNMGARAAGVSILSSRAALVKYIKRIFNNGIIHGDGDCHDPDWGCVIIQEYINSEVEWRTIYIGSRLMASQKLMRNGYHSGSHLVGWIRPPLRLMNFVREICEKNHLNSVNCDIFEDANHNFYVNEIQAIFGCVAPYQMLNNGIPGYFVFESGNWIFHEGIVCQNASFNLRVAALLEEFGITVTLPTLDSSFLDQSDVALSIAQTNQYIKTQGEYAK